VADPGKAIKEEPVEMDMTPMIDVVFLLIVFFLVSSHLARRETLLELDLPTADTGADPTHEDAAAVTVNVDSGGAILLGGAPTAPRELLERLRVEVGRSDGPIKVRVRADRASDYAAVEPVLAACAEAGVWNVTFAVYEEP